MSKTFNLSMDDKLLVAIDNFAKETRRTRSETIRIALEYYLYHNYPNPPQYMHKKLQTKPNKPSKESKDE